MAVVDVERKWTRITRAIVFTPQAGVFLTRTVGRHGWLYFGLKRAAK
jgi:hypothetical protein